jgi:hypothetical protein
MNDTVQSGSEAGALAIWHDVLPDAEEMVNAWYNREHHLDRVDLPGFLSARRYVALSGAPKYFCLYATRDMAALTSPEYLARLNNPTETSKRALPAYRNMSRTVCRQVLKLGLGEGGVVGTWRLIAQPARTDELMTWLRDPVLPALARRPEAVSVLLLRGDPATTNVSSRERKLRNDQDRLADLIVVLSANLPEQIERLRAELLLDGRLSDHGAAADSAFGVYRLVFLI